MDTYTITVTGPQFCLMIAGLRALQAQFLPAHELWEQSTRDLWDLATEAEPLTPDHAPQRVAEIDDLVENINVDASLTLAPARGDEPTIRRADPAAETTKALAAAALPRVTYRCEECGSDNLVWDAWVSWDDEAQKMEFAESYQDCLCNECGATGAARQCGLAPDGTITPLD